MSAAPGRTWGSGALAGAGAGFYGSGEECFPCTACDPHATQTGSCPAAGAPDSDGIACACDAGYYGDGAACAPCAHPAAGPGSCGPAATAYACAAGSATDTSACVCRGGYYGDGLRCDDCPEVMTRMAR